MKKEKLQLVRQKLKQTNKKEQLYANKFDKKKWTIFEKQRAHQTESRIYDLNRQIIKVQGQMASQANSTTYIQRTYSGPFQEEEILPKTFYKSPITLIPKLDKDTTKE